MKIIETKYLVISWEYNEYDKFEFDIFKYIDSSFFKRYSKIIDFTFFNRRVVLEF